MRIQNNMMAMNTYRQYNIANNSTSKYAEKLSSGYQINRAGDDAAGLAISEKMRAQIRGLNMASKNSLDAVSLIQTAEGALQSTHDILQRMRELAVQSSSDTNEQVIDRGALDQEFQALKAEIDDISTTTRFNDQNLLDGTFQKNISTLDNPLTNLHNVNAVSVARASAGSYDMKVSHTAAKEAKVLQDGVQTEIYQDNLLRLAGAAGKVNKVAFEGLETSDHNGNTYTVKVTGAEPGKMTFQLLDTNGDIVSTAQNVNTKDWGVGVANSKANTVKFEGVGTFTFALDEAITAASDLTSLSGTKISFIGGGLGYEHTISLGTVAAGGAFKSVEDAIVGGLDDAGGAAIGIAFKAGANPVTIMSASGSPQTYSLKVSTDKNGLITAAIVDGNGDAIQSGVASAIGIETGAGNAKKIDLGDFGEVPITNNGTVKTKPTPAVEGGIRPNDTSMAALTAAKITYVAESGSVGNVTALDAQPGALLTSGSLAGGTTASAIETAIEGWLKSANLKDLTVAGTQASGGDIAISFTYTDAGTGAQFKFDSGTLADAAAIEAALAGFKTAIDAVVIADIPSVKEGATLATEATGDIGVAGGIANHGNASDAAATSEVESSEMPTGGAEQVFQAASRAYLTLTINGEAVNLYKGDTYANFSNQGIAFEFNELSDTDILNPAVFLDEATAPSAAEKIVKIVVNDNIGTDLVIQSGANQGDELAINIDRISTETLGIAYSNIATRETASDAITEVNNAINQVSTQRAALGALQNRLEFKIANLDTSAENLQAAESRIRDTDMAKVMTSFTKSNILGQAATAMLAQANSQPQNVLQLLR